VRDVSLAWWSKLIDSVQLENGRAECGVDIWGNFAVAYQYVSPVLGIRAFYPMDSNIPESERIVIERNFSEIDKARFYDFVKVCYERYRVVEITPIEPLSVTVSPSVVEVLTPVWIEIKGTRGLADIEIYIDDRLYERFENQSVPQRSQ